MRLIDLPRIWKEEGVVLSDRGLRRKRAREQAQLVREQRAELERQREERERTGRAGS